MAFIKGTKGNDRLHGGQGDDTITGRAGDDRLSGRFGDDDLSGGDGNDILIGSVGLDRLDGGAGDDVLRGGTQRLERIGAAQDYLYGGNGNDTLVGGFGSDLLVGGSGSDRFRFHVLSDSTYDKPDVIDDFEQSKDKIAFRGGLRVDHDLHFIGQDAFSQVAGEVRFEVGGGKSTVLVDLDGNGVAEFRIIFNDEIQFQASDFSF